MSTKRFALGISYIGTEYGGFQSQRRGNSVQEVVETAIASVADHPVKIMCAGRTDKGVHAMLQVVHFDTTANRTENQWFRGINANLPNDIALIWVQAVNEAFHARFSAYARGYVYLLSNQDDLFMKSFSWRVQPLNIEAMQVAANHLLGEHDFHAFQSRHCQAEHAFRRVEGIKLVKDNQIVYTYIRANAFVHHMVRKIMATLVAVGEGKISPDDVKTILVSKDRERVPGQAPARGLFLREVKYPEKWGLPESGESQFLGKTHKQQERE